MRLHLRFLFATIVSFACSVLAACGHFKDDPTKSVWAGGLWILPWATFIAFIIFSIKAIKSYNSGTISGGSDPGRQLKGKTVNVGYTVFAVIFLLATIAIVWYQNTQR